MAIERFTLSEFECALPKRKPIGDEPAKSMANYVGLVQGEHCFILQPYDNIPVGLFIRSSVDISGVAADTGEDSIRVLWCALDSKGYSIIGNKAKAYTTRVKGWESRLLALLRKLTAGIRFCRPCPKCGTRLTPFTTKKGDNAGRVFVTCGRCKNGEKSSVFFWCESDLGEPLDLPKELQSKGKVTQ